MSDEEVSENRNNIEYWLHWLRGAKKGAERHWQDASAAWKEYELEEDLVNKTDDNKESVKPFCIYWSSCKTLEPAYYSKTPEVKVKRRFSIEDSIANTGALIGERLGAYLAETSHLTTAMRAAVGDSIHADKATVQLVYKATKSIDETGKEVVTDQKISVAPLCHDEVLHSPEAKSQDEITEIAIKFCLPHEEAEARFNGDGEDGQPRGRTLPYKNSKSYARSEDDKERTDIPGKYLEGWEIWCLLTKKVYWVCEDYKEGFLDIKDDIYGLRDFFPIPPFVISSKPRKSLYPTPAFIHLWPTIKKLHELRTKIYDLIDCLRRRAIVDGSHPELMQLSQGNENEFIAIQNLQALLEKGSLENLVLFFPVEEFVSAISEANTLEEKFKNDISEWFGVPDILRGVSDPIETAKAQKIKTTSAHNRFSTQKAELAELARASIEMMVDLALKVFPDEKIMQVVGFNYLEEDHKKNFPVALEFLRNDTERFIRIDIETDSTGWVNEEIELQRRKALAEMVLNGLGTIGGMKNLEFGAVALQCLLSTIEGVGGSKEYEEGVKKAVAEHIKKMQQPREPEPNYEMIKAQIEGQKNQIAQQKNELSAELQSQKILLDSKLKAKEIEQKEYRMALDAIKIQSEVKVSEFSAEFKSLMEQALLRIEQQRVAIESFQAKIQALESLQEEARLAAAEAPKIAAEGGKSPPININFGGKSKSKKKTARVTRDKATGDLLGTIEEIDDEGNAKTIFTKIKRLPSGELEGEINSPSSGENIVVPGA